MNSNMEFFLKLSKKLKRLLNMLMLMDTPNLLEENFLMINLSSKKEMNMMMLKATKYIPN
jgi:hypothetical protein